MTTLTATLEDFWDDLDPMPQSPFSTLETFPDSDTSSECETEEVSLFSTQVQQEHIASALESALHEALAKYSVSQSKQEANTRSAEISEFWNGWIDDIEIDDEINSIEDDTYSIDEDEIAKAQHPTNQQHSTSLPTSPPPPPSQGLIAAVATTTTVDPSKDTVSTSVSEALPLEKQRKKRRGGKRNVCGKSKKRKCSSSEEERNMQHHHRKKFTSSALKEVFKLEQVLKIKTADQDSENEEVDIGDSTTWNG